MLEDAGSLRRKKDFSIGNKKAELFIKRHWGKPNIDDYLEFLNKTEKVGSFTPLEKVHPLRKKLSKGAKGRGSLTGFILPSRRITRDKDFRL